MMMMMTMTAGVEQRAIVVGATSGSRTTTSPTTAAAAAPLETDSAAPAAIIIIDDGAGADAGADADAEYEPPPMAAAAAAAAATSTTTTTTISTATATAASSSSSSATLQVHASLVGGQVLFGLGSVVAALGLPACHPLTFALARESSAACILLTADQVSVAWNMRRAGEEAIVHDSNHNHHLSHHHHHHHKCPWPQFFWAPLRHHTARFLLLGMAIFANQSGNIAGIKLAGPVAAAVWQPSQPVITAAITMLCLQSEPVNRYRMLGVALAFLGCALMVAISGRKTREDGGGDGGADGDADGTMSMTFLVGNVLFFVNCSGTALYVILSKPVLAMYRSLQVTAWSYVVASIFMLVTAVAVSSSETATHFLCPDCTSSSVWRIPKGAVPALAYFVVCNSVMGYGITTWANRHASGTLVMGYTVLQPVSAALATVALLDVAHLYPRCTSATTTTAQDDGDNDNNAAAACLDPPGWGSVAGMVGVFAGLYLVIVTEPPPAATATPPAVEQQRYGAVATNEDDGDDGDDLRVDDDDDDDGLLLEPTATTTTDRDESNH